MLSSRGVFVLGLVNLLVGVSVSQPSAMKPAPEEFSDESCIMNFTLRNFQLILSWELKNKSIIPTHYTLWYTIMSKAEDAKIVGNCTNINRTFCDLTDVWQEMHETYVPMLQVFSKNSTVANCWDSIEGSNLSLEPPEFEIVGFSDHINVTVNFPPVIPKIYQKEMKYYMSFFIKEKSEKKEKLHKPSISENVGRNFTYVIRNLIPNSNYCVSVYFEPINLGRAIESPLKCIFLQPDQEAGPSESTRIGVTVGALIVAVVIIAIIIMKRIGYICLKNNLPKVLNFHNVLAWVFPELPTLEAVDVLEVIHVSRKKKLWNYDYDDDSDSDSEAVPRANANGYTMHGLVGKLLSQTPASSGNCQGSQVENSEGEESDNPETQAGTEAVPEPPVAPGTGPYERRENLLHDPLPEDDSGSLGEPGDRVTFNVDLNSVFLRVLHSDSEEASVDTSEVSSLVGGTMDLEDPPRPELDLLVASGGQTQPLRPGLSSQCLGTEDDTSSDKTEASDSDADADLGDGYIMR